MKRKKLIHFQNERAHNLETPEGIHMKNGNLLETSLQENCGKPSSMPPKNWESSSQKSSY